MKKKKGGNFSGKWLTWRVTEPFDLVLRDLSHPEVTVEIKDESGNWKRIRPKPVFNLDGKKINEKP